MLEEVTGREYEGCMDLIGAGYSDTQYAAGKYQLHCHNFYEVYYFLEGDVDYLVEGQPYTLKEHSILLLSPHVFHGVRVNSSLPYRRYSMHFHREILSVDHRSFLLSVFPDLEKNPKGPVYLEHVEEYHVEEALQAVCQYTKMQPLEREQLVPIGVEGVLARIAAIENDVSPAKGYPAADGLAMEILNYLNRHLFDELTLDGLAERFLVSRHYLNRVFKKAVGTTVFDYLLQKRVIHAQQMLIHGSSAAEAASASGFGDYSAFYRAYLRILGHPPLKDRGVLPNVSGILERDY